MDSMRDGPAGLDLLIRWLTDFNEVLRLDMEMLESDGDDEELSEVLLQRARYAQAVSVLIGRLIARQNESRKRVRFSWSRSDSR